MRSADLMFVEAAMMSGDTTGDNRPVRVLVVDDHPIVRAGVRFSLSRQPGFEICGEAANVESAIAMARDAVPHLVILDFMLGGRDGIEAITRMREALPFSAILVYSMNPEELFADSALKAGASGYIMKTGERTEFLRAVDKVLRGESYLSERMISRVLKARTLSAGGLSELSDREMQVFLRMGEGKTTGEIAADLHLSVKTISTHRENMKTKLGVASGAELSRLAISHVLQQGKFH